MYGMSGNTNIDLILQDATLIKKPAFSSDSPCYDWLLFKIGLFPFHLWIPDVYEGAPTIITGFMSTSGKIAAVGFIAPFLISMNVTSFVLIFSIIAVFTMLFANITALMQTISTAARILIYSKRGLHSCRHFRTVRCCSEVGCILSYGLCLRAAWCIIIVSVIEKQKIRGRFFIR